MLMSNKIDVLGLDFLEDFPICQYWTKHLGIALGIYILGMPSFRQNKINIPASSDLVLHVPKLSDFISSLQQIPDPVHSHNSVLTAVSLISLNLHYCPIISCKKKQLQTTTALVAPYRSYSTDLAWSCILKRLYKERHCRT